MKIEEFLDKIEEEKNYIDENSWVYECCKKDASKDKLCLEKKDFIKEIYVECPHCVEEILLYKIIKKEPIGKFKQTINESWVFDSIVGPSGNNKKEIQYVAASQEKVLNFINDYQYGDLISWDKHEIIHKKSKIILTDQKKIVIINNIKSLFQNKPKYFIISDNEINFLKNISLYDEFCTLYLQSSIMQINDLHDKIREIKYNLGKTIEYIKT